MGLRDYFPKIIECACAYSVLAKAGASFVGPKDLAC